MRLIIMHYRSGIYRVNADFFRDDFRSSGAVLPYSDVQGARGTYSGCLAAQGFLDARCHENFRFSLMVVGNRLSVDWACKVSDDGDVRDVEGEVNFTL